jgi:hypothetical protein
MAVNYNFIFMAYIIFEEQKNLNEKLDIVCLW